MEKENKDIVGETLKVQDIENFFKHFINPALTEAKIEKATAAQMKREGGFPTTPLIVLAAILLVGVIAYTMLSNNSKDERLIGNLATCASENAQLRVQNSQRCSADATETPSNPIGKALPSNEPPPIAILNR